MEFHCFPFFVSGSEVFTKLCVSSILNNKKRILFYYLWNVAVHPPIHPSVHVSSPPALHSGGLLEPVPAVFGATVGFHPSGSPALHRVARGDKQLATTSSSDSSKSAVTDGRWEEPECLESQRTMSSAPESRVKHGRLLTTFCLLPRLIFDHNMT